MAIERYGFDCEICNYHPSRFLTFAKAADAMDRHERSYRHDAQLLRLFYGVNMYYHMEPTDES